MSLGQAVVVDPWTAQKKTEFQAALVNAMPHSVSGFGQATPATTAPFFGWAAVVAIAAGIFWFTTNPPKSFSTTANRRMRRNGDPAPKFRVGDKVRDRDGSRRGVVSYIYPSYDDVIGGYRYKVLEADGTRLYWNEGSMVKLIGGRGVRRNHGSPALAKALYKIEDGVASDDPRRASKWVVAAEKHGATKAQIALAYSHGQRRWNKEHPVRRNGTLKIGDRVEIPAGTRHGMSSFRHPMLGEVTEIQHREDGTEIYGITYADSLGKKRHTWVDGDQVRKLLRRNSYDPMSRFNDLQKQGFMKPRKARKPKVARPTVACSDCLNWHPKGKHTADAATRKANRALPSWQPERIVPNRTVVTPGRLSVIEERLRSARTQTDKQRALHSAQFALEDLFEYAPDSAEAQRLKRVIATSQGLSANRRRRHR